jgi:peptide deformylase
MITAPGGGLAAPQIGVMLRVFTYDVDGELGHLINPDLDLSDEEQEDLEGCLSIPDLSYSTMRSTRVVAKGFNMYGDPVTIEGTGYLAGLSSTKPITLMECSLSIDSMKQRASWP